MTLPKFAVSRPVTIIVIFTLIVGLGLFLLAGIPIDLYPDFNPPVLVVITTYSGAGPEDIEKNVTRILEGNLSNVADLKEITSTSSEGSSLILLEFDWNKNMAEAANDIRDRLEFAKSFMPEDAETPVLYKFDPSMIPILFLTVDGSRSPEELKNIAEDIIQPAIEQVKGVALTRVNGGRDRIIRAAVSKNRLEAYSLTISEIAGAISSQNIDVGGGSVSSGSYNFLVRSKGEFKKIEEIENTVIAYRSESTGGAQTAVKLKDVAEVSYSLEDETESVFINGRPGIYLIVQKQSGSNSVKTAENVLRKIDKLNRELPKGVRLSVLRDTTTIIKDSILQVSRSALTGALFAMAVLLFFLRTLKSTLVIGVSIPISLLITLMGMYFTGITINILSLAGLTLGVGMIVDSSIVILENIYRYREKGAQLKASAVLGSEEMKGAITASTLTTICVFIPIVMFRSDLGFIGIMFSDLAFTVVVALVASLIVALVLVPVLASRYLKIYTKKQKPINNTFLAGIDNASESFFVELEKLYRKALGIVLRRRKTTIASVTGIFVLSLALLPLAGLELSPASGDDEVTLSVELPVGSNLETTKEVLNRLEKIAETEIDGYEDIIKTSGSASGFFSAADSYKGELYISLPQYSGRKDSSDDVKKKLRSHFSEFPGVVFRFTAGRQGGPRNPDPIDIMVKSDDLELASETALAIKKLIQTSVPEAKEPDTDIKNSLPEVEVRFDRERMYELGLSASSVGSEIKAAVNGIRPTKYRAGDEELDVLVILKESDRKELPDLKTIYVTNKRGEYIPVSAFASLETGTGPVDIKRVDQTRVIHVKAGIEKGVKLNIVEKKIEKLIHDNIILDDAVTIEYSGDYGDLMDYGRKFLVIMVLALFLVYGVMASQFESFKDPFIMFLTVPLMLIGVVLIHLVLAKPFSLFTAVGVVMLAGIVVNNGIVLVDYTNLLVGRGYPLYKACVEAGVSRLRPILMTTLTTILGMVPLAFFPGEGSELVQPIGQTVIGGLATSTVITLVFIPVMYYVFNRKRMEGNL